jgi:hypothetical protein
VPIRGVFDLPSDVHASAVDRVRGLVRPSLQACDLCADVLERDTVAAADVPLDPLEVFDLVLGGGVAPDDAVRSRELLRDQPAMIGNGRDAADVTVEELHRLTIAAAARGASQAFESREQACRIPCVAGTALGRGRGAVCGLRIVALASRPKRGNELATQLANACGYLLGQCLRHASQRALAPTVRIGYAFERARKSWIVGK